jgi:hypothetical protein
MDSGEADIIKRRFCMNKKSQLFKVFVIGIVLLIIGAVTLSSYQSSATVDAFVGNIAQLDLFTDHHHQPPQPTLTINHTHGKKGSYFLISGSNYPILNTIEIKVNNHLVGYMQLDEFGSAQFELSTDQADNGVYFVNVTAAVDAPTDNSQIFTAPSANTQFTINSQAPLHTTEGTADVFNVPSGIALSHYNFLPTIINE